MQFLLRRGDGLAGGPPGGLCRCTIRHSRTVNPPNPLRHNRAQRLSSRYSTCLSTRPGLALHAPPSTLVVLRGRIGLWVDVLIAADSATKVCAWIAADPRNSSSRL